MKYNFVILFFNVFMLPKTRPTTKMQCQLRHKRMKLYKLFNWNEKKTARVKILGLSGTRIKNTFWYCHSVLFSIYSFLVQYGLKKQFEGYWYQHLYTAKNISCEIWARYGNDNLPGIIKISARIFLVDKILKEWY